MRHVLRLLAPLVLAAIFLGWRDNGMQPEYTGPAWMVLVVAGLFWACVALFVVELVTLAKGVTARRRARVQA